MNEGRCEYSWIITQNHNSILNHKPQIQKPFKILLKTSTLQKICIMEHEDWDLFIIIIIHIRSLSQIYSQLKNLFNVFIHTVRYIYLKAKYFRFFFFLHKNWNWNSLKPLNFNGFYTRRDVWLLMERVLALHFAWIYKAFRGYVCRHVENMDIVS